MAVDTHYEAQSPLYLAYSVVPNLIIVLSFFVSLLFRLFVVFLFVIFVVGTWQIELSWAEPL